MAIKNMKRELAVVKEAIELLEQKNSDYNSTIPREMYFPFDNVSYAHMLQTKALRFTNIVKNEMFGVKPNFETKRDTLLDIINYAAMAIVALDEE